MAPLRSSSKRPRAFTDDFESVNGETRAGQRSRGKRPRRSPSEDRDRHSSTPAPSEIDPKTADEEESDEELDEIATQRLTRQFRDDALKQNLPAENGIIEEISCTNFMCHEHLTVKLGPLINFVIGHNGSGKSAVLTALTLCLGGKPGATNRGSSLKSFIKEGKDFSVLSVKIKNKGSAAFKRDKYKDAIYVERHFSKTGTSGFKIKDSQGKIISTKKQELEDIIDAFALQIDNPLNVLTQDMARQFLNDSSPKAKYKFFLKGTQLETLNKDYNLIKTSLDETEGRMKTLTDDLEILRTRAQEAIDKAKRSSNMERMRLKEAELLNQSAWAVVQEEEAHLAVLDREINHIQATIDERNVEVDARTRAYEIANEACSNANKDVEDRQAEMIPLQEEREQKKEMVGTVKQSIMEIQANQRRIGGAIGNKEKSIASFETKIEEERKRQEEADNGEYARKVDELEDAKRSAEQARENLKNHENTYSALDERTRAAQSRKKAADEKTEEKRSEVRLTQRNIRDLEGGQQNWMNAYNSPANLQRLLNEIQQERRFQQTPIGPMGRYIKLLKPEWSSLLEKQSGASLGAFVVTSQADQKVLSQLLRKTNYSCPIFIGQGSPIDTTGHEPDPQFDTWLRVLKFDNDLVRNQMIIHHSIDQIVLIESREEAENLMHEGGQRRRNVRMCCAMSDDGPQKGHSVSYNSQTGAVNLGPINQFQGRPRMQTDKNSQISAATSNLRRLQEDLRKLETESREQTRLVQECEKEVDQYRRQLAMLKRSEQQTGDIVYTLEDDLASAAPAAAGLIEQLQESLESVRQEKEFEENQFQDTVIEKDKLDQQNRKNLAALTAIQRQIDQLNVEIGKASSKADKMKNKREEELRELNRAHERVKAAEANKDEWEQRRGEQIAQLEATTSQALTICPRVEVPRGMKAEELAAKRQALQQARREIEEQLGGSEQELLAAANIAKKKHKEANDDLAAHREIAKRLTRSLANRQERWERFKQEITLRAHVMFGYLLSERGYRGGLKVNHNRERLLLKVEPDGNQESGSGRETNTLSGGEKSFSTICLLLSLWEAMGSPIRCLDEFDVFMDSVNRDISMKMMIEAARRAIGRQFILITPQAMNSVQSVGDVRIIKMNDPVRGQTTLNMGT